MWQKVLYNFLIAAESIRGNKIRSLLTMLGIIFGVASVIAMLAIGRGAEQEVLEQIKLLGANNVIIKPIVEQEEGRVEEVEDGKAEKKPWSPGLTMADALSIAAIVPGVEAVSPEVVIETEAVRAGLRRSTKLVGVDERYFDQSDFHLAEGNFFSDEQLESAAPVAIIGQRVKTRFFTKEEPLGRRIKCGNLWLTVVGVLEERALTDKSIEALGIRDFNYDIYTPVKTVLLRYEDRARVTAQEVETANSAQAQFNNNNSQQQGPVNYHQLDQLVVRVEASDLVQPVAEVVNRMLKRRHYGVVDYEVIVPEQLLQQERRTQAIFNIVLAAIASISLIVGGIGIMNIMLASVLERTREIGVRRSVGATRHDVTLQFLIEAITISFTGGVIGIILGVLISLGIELSTGIQTIVSAISVVVAFLVSVSVGLIFGLLPAKRAAEHHPVVALRYE
jgi:putative ABC transport system permease protein